MCVCATIEMPCLYLGEDFLFSAARDRIDFNDVD